ncbi:MarR family winged helix-turn-helix transcriptional regulator [Thermogemmatispora sp.]|uniref:MarR family winged helix-turn-helix transcriptional regulator n=1 Tax=Thermogemmatispora sp. TaxID=1968838 RepID=UPI0035E427BD
MDDYRDYRLFQELSLLLDHADRLVLRQFNLNTLQYNALLLLDPEEGWRLTDLSERLLCERSTVTRLVDYLESEGLLIRSPDPTDRRSQRVRLTAEGVARRRQAQAAIEEAIGRRFSILSREEERQLIAMLKRLRNVVSAEIEATLKEDTNS